MSKILSWGEKPNQPKQQKLNTWVDEVKELSNNDGKDKENAGLFGEFIQTATVHGLKHTYGTGRGCFRRGFWCFAFLGMLCVLLYTVFTQLALLMTYPTITKQSMEFRGTMPFPAVTLCNLNQFRKSVAGNEATKQILLAMSDIGEAYSINWEDPIWANISESMTPEKFKRYIKNIAHPLEWTLIRCTWDNQVYECGDLFFTQITDFGYCYTFNFREHVNSTQKIALHPGSKYGLTVIANIMHDEYLLSADSDAAGLRVLLHDFDETPLVNGRGFDVGPGSATKGSLKARHVTFLPPPYTSFLGVKCTNTSGEDFSNFLKLYDHYDINACISECRYNYVYNICNCQSFYDTGNLTSCSPREYLECYFPAFEQFITDNLSWYCGCPVPCVWNIYEAAVSTASYPSKPLMEQANILYNTSMDENTFRQNYLKLTLAYDFFLRETIEQAPQYTFETIMSTLGGQLGIFLGASLLSLLEFMELGLAFLICKVLRVGNKAAQKK